MAFSIKFTEGVCPGKKLQTLKRSAEEIYDASAAVLTKGLLNFKPAGWKIVPGYFMTRKQTDRLNFYGSVTHVRGHTIIQTECGKTRNLEIVFNAYIVSIKLH